jgi:hypothetical protein
MSDFDKALVGIGLKHLQKPNNKIRRRAATVLRAKMGLTFPQNSYTYI